MPGAVISLGGLILPYAYCEIGVRQSSIKDVAFPGLDGTGGLDMGLRMRPITITGFLPDAVDGSTKARDIEGLPTGTALVLDTGIGGRKFSFCLVLSATCGPLQFALGPGGGKFECTYTIQLAQRRFD